MSVDLVRIVDSIHRDKNISKDILFEGIQSALTTAARKHYPEAGEIEVRIDPDSGAIDATKDGVKMDPAELGRIAAQTAKQVIIQKIREAERDSLFDEFEDQRGDLVTGTVQRFEGGAVIVNLGKTDAILPRSEQIPGESYHPNERIRAIILDVRKVGQRVKIILSRTHSDFVRRLFELEIPEIADQIIAIRALAREAGYRSKVAVTSIDTKVDAVGACVGVRGTRIKNIVDELGGERIDIVRWNESLQVLIPNALQPAEIDEVMLCHLLGRAIVLGSRRSALTGHRPPWPERSARLEAGRLGHRNHDRRRARRSDREGGQGVRKNRNRRDRAGRTTCRTGYLEL